MTNYRTLFDIRREMELASKYPTPSMDYHRSFIDFLKREQVEIVHSDLISVCVRGLTQAQLQKLLLKYTLPRPHIEIAL